MKTLTVVFPYLGAIVAEWHDNRFKIMTPTFVVDDTELIIDCGRGKLYLTSWSGLVKEKASAYQQHSEDLNQTDDIRSGP